WGGRASDCSGGRLAAAVSAPLARETLPSSTRIGAKGAVSAGRSRGHGGGNFFAGGRVADGHVHRSTPEPTRERTGACSDRNRRPGAARPIAPGAGPPPGGRGARHHPGAP